MEFLYESLMTAYANRLSKELEWFESRNNQEFAPGNDFRCNVCLNIFPGNHTDARWYRETN